MYPKLFDIGPVSVYSYGLMLAIAFLVGNTILLREFRRNKISEESGIVITFLALIGGIVGGKIFYIIEEWNFGSGVAIKSYLTPDVLFTGLGLTFYGGLVVAMILIVIYCRIKKIQLLNVLDILSLCAAIGYGIARIGCHLSGDGDYGIAVNGTIWEFLGYSYIKGTVPTQAGVLVHPTPLYELIASIIIFLYLWSLRNKSKFTGEIFSFYLILTGIARFLVEFIRLNPKIIFNLSQAQIISLMMIISGIVLYFIRRRQTAHNN